MNTQDNRRRGDKYLYESILLPRALTRAPLRVVPKLLWSMIVGKPFGCTYYLNLQQKQIFDLIAQINREVIFLLTDEEAYQIFQFVKSTQKIDGDIAEVGVYEGGSSKLICEAKRLDTHVHLFDTFEGLPETGLFDGSLHQGDYCAPFEQVKKYLEPYSHVHIHKGIFPFTAESLKNNRFSFVHLDVDTYSSTLACLQYFYPRMTKGGVILSHDYCIRSSLQGAVKRAFTEFFTDKPEIIVGLPSSQGFVSKL